MLSASGIIPGHKLLRPCYKFSAKTVESQTLDIAQLLFGQALRHGCLTRNNLRNFIMQFGNLGTGEYFHAATQVTKFAEFRRLGIL